jgi:NADH dehydrogenase FAD-containing subunit
VRESAAPADATVSAGAFAALFAGGAKFREVVDALSAGASAKASAEERLVKVSILPEGGGEAAAAADGGLVLVGPTTSLEDVRAQLRSRFEEESADDPLLSTGRFTFLSSGRPVRRKQEKLVRGKHVGEPVTIQPDKNAKLSLKDAADDIKESAAEAAKAKAAKAAQELIAAGARREATMLDLDEVMRHNLRSASLRRHAAAAAAEGVADAAEAKARRAAAEKDAQIAILCLTLNDALVANDVAKSLRIAEQLRGFAKAGAGSTEGLAADAPPAAIADAMRPREMDARAALSPALERMRAEMFAASSGGALKGSGAQAADAKDLKRVVILGGGPCGASILHQLVHIHAGFHVTVVDTKEYYEDTPCVLRMMVGNDVDHIWHNLNINFGDIIRGKPHAEYICGTAAAVRKDHVLVGTTNGVASRVVPYDYLVLATGSHYQSDIKTEGASIAHRYESFAMERERMKEVSSFAVIGAGLVGIQLACELRHYFPDKEVNVYTRAGGWLPRVPGAHDNVLEEIDRQGINLVKGKEIVSTDEEGRMVTREGEKIGPPGARTYWCTGYKPNNSYLLDTRTDPDIASELDEWGFVKVSPANRMSEAKGLGHIYAGGDLATKAVHNHGERTAAGAWMHAGAIVENILLASGKREGAPKMAAINFFAGTDLEVSLGPKAGLLYATNPGFESFFHDPTKLKEKYGELAAAGRSGWQEFQAGTINDMGCVNWMMFNMIPEGAANMYTKDDMTIWGMFVAPALLDIPPPAAE